MPDSPHLGKLPPKHRFILNPYVDARFSSCPSCGQPTKLRKLPFFVHVDPRLPVVLNMSHRYCPACDLIILHRDRLEALLMQLFPDHDPETLRKQYLVMGTVERAAFRASLKTPLSIAEMLEYLHDFTERLTVQSQPIRWHKDES
ncbi:MAG TPA: hypothetical protein PKH92_02235 [Anaerolineaceae bacterium]|nr:hypothetical protein [Anaerolineaceae bacterium]